MLGWSKALGMTPQALLHDISYQNLLLLSAAAPDYSSKSREKRNRKEEPEEAPIDGNNPEAVAAEEAGKPTKIRVRK